MMYVLLAITILLIVAVAYALLQIKLLWEQQTTKRKREKQFEKLAYTHNEALLQMFDDVEELKKMTADIHSYNKAMNKLP